MSATPTPEVTDRLIQGHYGWLTTVAKSGQPVPKLIWFYFDGVAVYVYTNPAAAKVGHVKRHPLVSLNLDSDGNGGGIIVIGGEATVDAEGVDCRDDEPYWAKYGATADQFGWAGQQSGPGIETRVRTVPRRHAGNDQCLSCLLCL